MTTKVEALRESLLRELHGLNAVRTEAVERAVDTVPRHLFAPGEPLERAYAAEQALVTKRDEQGVALSSISAVRIQAFMLEQADIRPGMRVLEIGSGGYNAALIAELVGCEGEVTSIDIDPEVVDRARRLLDAAGYGRVRTAVADGETGYPTRAPFDRILLTVEAWDIPPAWTDQLATGGRIVVPLRTRGLTRSVALEPEGDRLISRGYELCGFVPMQGSGQHRVREVVLHEEKDERVTLQLDNGQQVDTVRLRASLTQPRTEAWSGVLIGGMVPFDDLDLWLATNLSNYALLTGTSQARDRGLVASAAPIGVSTLVAGASFAYRTVRPVDDTQGLYEFGAYAHGPEAEQAADHLIEQIRTWDRDHRTHHATYQGHPPHTPADQLPAGRVLHTKHRILTISWPQAATGRKNPAEPAQSTDDAQGALA